METLTLLLTSASGAAVASAASARIVMTAGKDMLCFLCVVRVYWGSLGAVNYQID